MIHIAYSGPQDQEWKVRAEVAREKVLVQVVSGERPSWKKQIWKSLKPELLAASFNKCAYCESKIGANFYVQVEHYRPKGGVTEGRVPIDHPGYYWLAYEWQNLLPTCNHCNSPHENRMPDGTTRRHPGKGQEFRIEGQRVQRPAKSTQQWMIELERERPLLLHPYFDNPQEHLAFDDLGFVYGTTERGIETRKVCDLDRPRLVKNRNAAREIAFARLARVLTAWLENPTANAGELPVVEPEDEYCAWLVDSLGSFERLMAEVRTRATQASGSYVKPKAGKSEGDYVA